MGWWGIGEDQVMGDTPADIMGEAVDRVVKAYERDWDRKPTAKELVACLAFVCGHLDYQDKTGEKIYMAVRRIVYGEGTNRRGHQGPA